MKSLRSIIAATAFVLSGSAAFAAPVLRSDIVVIDPVVTVGDMFDEAGALAELPLFRSPLPGTTGNVDLTTLRQAAGRIGLNTFDTAGLTGIRVSRAATIVDETMFRALISQDLRARGIITQGMDANTTFDMAVTPIAAAATDTPVHLISLRYLPGNGTFSARFAISGREQTVDLTGAIALMVEAPHLVSSLPAGSVLRPEDIVMRPVPAWQANAQGIPAMDQLVGMALNRQSRDGMLLRASDVSTPLAVAKNDLVTIYYRQGPMTLTVRGQAVTGAAKDAPLQVLNLVSRRVISAVAVAPGVVEISNAPVTFAGL
jgi:flagella basal body P-ring formation protein FlgA